MTLHSAVDIVGDDAKHALAATPTRARRLWITSHSGASRLGDANVGAARGVELTTDIEVTFSASDGDITDSIDLSTVNVYVPSGSTVTYSWGV